MKQLCIAVIAVNSILSPGPSRSNQHGGLLEGELISDQ